MDVDLEANRGAEADAEHDWVGFGRAASPDPARREEIGFSYVVFGADFADLLASVVAELAGR